MTTGNSEHKAGLMMILSPAKTLDFEPWENEFGLTLSKPDCDAVSTQKIALEMKSRNKSELGKLLSISVELAQTAHTYWNDYDVHDEGDRGKPCIFTFSGAAYQGLQISTCDQDAILHLQHSLRIIDPLYGILRPLDKIQPYRLEMLTKGVFREETSVKLADFWKDKVTDYLSLDLVRMQTAVLLNLASEEYSAAILESRLPDHVSYVKVVFQENGRVVSVHAKRARGLMVRFIATTRPKTLEDIKTFGLEGYQYCKSKSDDRKIVFDRPKQKTDTRARPNVDNQRTTKKSRRK